MHFLNKIKRSKSLSPIESSMRDFVGRLFFNPQLWSEIKIFFKKTLCTILIVFILTPFFQAPVHALFYSDEQQELQESQVVAPEVKNTPLVAVLVEDSLLSNHDIRERIERYGQDLQVDLRAKVVQIPISRETSPFEIYEGLAHLYFAGLDDDSLSKLIGVVMMGDIPLSVVEKNDNYWPTVYPYVDFENPSYHWDVEKERFVFHGGDDEPEIWHGVINPGVDGQQAQEQELEEYLDFNHAVHQGDVHFSKKVFYADFFHQNKVLPDMLYNHYKRWIRYAEEIFYHRFTKHFARKLFQEFDEEQQEQGIGVSSQLTETQKDQIVQQALSAGSSMTEAQIRDQMDINPIDQMSDIQSKVMSENFLKRYQEAYQSWLSRLGGKIESMGRWGADNVDTTVSLITKKDESSVLLLQSVNEAIEEVLKRQLEEKNFAEHIPVYPTVDVPDQDDIVTRPLYWNGVERNGMDAENCTLMRGNPRSENYPFTQQAEANRTLNPTTTSSCKHRDEPGRTLDPYEGCCGKNMEYSDGNFSYHTCDTTSTWQSPDIHQGAELEVFDITGTREVEGPMGASGCVAILRFDNEEPAYRFSSLFIHDEPRAVSITEQVEAGFSRTLPVDDPRGFSFYDHGRRFQRVDFPNIFNFRDLDGIEVSEEDTKQRIIAGIREEIRELNMIGEEGNKLSEQRLNSEASIPWPGTVATPPGVPVGGSVSGDCDYADSLITVDVFTLKRTWTEDCSWVVTDPQLNPPTEDATVYNVISHYYEAGDHYYNAADHSYGPDEHYQDLIDEEILEREVFEIIGWEDILEALHWIDKDVEAKNRIVLEKALSETENFQDFFFDEESDGYELFQITSEGDPVKGLKMAFFPEISNTEDEEYLDILNGIAHFAFDVQRQRIRFMGKDFEKDILGISDRKEESSATPAPMLGNEDELINDPEAVAENAKDESDWSKAIGEWASDFTGMGTSFADMGPDAGKARKTVESSVHPNFGTGVRAKIHSLEISPTEIRVAANDVSPVKVEVLLKDELGEVITSDYESKVNLVFMSSDAADFFHIGPDQEMPVEAGKTTFFLIPKTRDVGGQFGMVAMSKGKTSEEVSVKITSIDLRVLGTVLEPVIVRDQEGMLIRARVQDLQNNLVSNFDGKILTFSSQWGSFQGGGDDVVENGMAQILFFPGEKAGQAVIYVEDQEQNLPLVNYNFDILPAAPSLVELRTPSRYFVPARKYMPLSFHVLDRYGNEVRSLRHNVTWELEGLEVRNFESRDNDSGTSGIQEFLRRGMSELMVRPEPGVEIVSVQVHSDAEEGIEAAVTLEVLDRALLEVRISHESVVAGGADLVQVLIEAKTAEGELIDGDFEINVVSSTEEILQLPENAELLDGRGSFSFYPGTKSSEMILSFSSSGFITTEIPFEILPDEAKKIEMSVTKDVLDLSKDESEIVDISIHDRYGNQVKHFPRDISIRLTETTEDFLELEKGTVEMQRGRGMFRVWGKKLAGKAHIIAEGTGLVPAALEIELANFLTTEDLSRFHPKALFTMLLGFGAGDVRFSENFADRFLFSGKTQSVATLISDPDPKYRFASLSPSGEFLGNVKAQFKFSKLRGAVAFPEVSIISQGEEQEAVATARFLFSGEPDVFLDAEEMEDEGIYLNFKDGIKEDIHSVENEILLDGEVLFKITDHGGILRGERVVDFRTTENIRKWIMLLDDERIGELTFILPETLYPVDYLRAEGEPGIMLKAIIPRSKTEEIFVGNSTHAERGLAIMASQKKEYKSRMLNSSRITVEETPKKEAVGWTADWKPAALFASQNSIGQSTQYASGEAFILFGDPSLALRDRNEETDFGFSQDLGKPIWKSLEGQIDQVLSGDVNGDEVIDLITRVRDRLYVLYQVKSKDLEIGDRDTYFLPEHNFRETGPLLHFRDGVKNVIALDNNLDSLIDLIHLNDAGQLVYHWNRGGKYERESIDLELQNKIVQVKSARLNSDRLTDIVLLDEQNNLYFSYAHEYGFFTPQYLDNFSPNFSMVEERFSAESVSVTSRFKSGGNNTQYEDLKYLSAMYISYQGMGTEVTEEDDVLSFTDPDNETREIDLSNLEDAFSEDFLQQIPFMQIVQNNTFHADYSMELQKEGTRTVKPGDEIQVTFAVRASKNLENFQFQPPVDNRLELIQGTLSCDRCEGEVLLKNRGGQGLFWAYGINLEKNRRVTFTWRLMVMEVPEVEFFIGDFENNRDDIDDISIPWENEEGDPQIINFLSSESTSKRPGWVASSAGGSVQFVQHKRSIESVKPNEDPMESVEEYFDMNKDNPGETLQMLRERMGEDSDGDGYPDNWDQHPSTSNQSILGLMNEGTLGAHIGQKSGETDDSKSDLICGGGTCFGIPISIAFFAPGLITQYIPPVSVPKGIAWGYPLISVLTTLWAGGPIPSIWPTVPIGVTGIDPVPQWSNGVYPSFLRLYLMPTTTGKMGLSICLGMYKSHMIPPLWVPNCFTSILSPIDLVGLCPLEGVDVGSLISSAGAAVSGAEGGLISVSGGPGGGGGNGNFSAKVSPETNIQIPGVDIVSTWTQDQMREFAANLTLSSLSVKMPNVDRNSMTGATSADFLSGNGGAVESAFSALSNTPFLETTSSQISIPHVPEQHLEQRKTEVEAYLKDLDNKMKTHLNSSNIDRIKGQIAEMRNKIANLNKIGDSLPDLSHFAKLKVPKMSEVSGLTLQLASAESDIPDVSLASANVHNAISRFSTAKAFVVSEIARFRSEYESNCVNVVSHDLTECQKAFGILEQSEGYKKQLNDQVAQLLVVENTLSEVSDYRQILTGLKAQAFSSQDSLTNYQQQLSRVQNVSAQVEGFKTQIDQYAQVDKQLAQMDSSLDKMKNLRPQIEGLKTALEANLQTMESYKDGQKTLLNMRMNLQKSLSKLIESVNTQSEFLDSWSQSVLSRVGEWKQAQKILHSTLDVWQLVPDIFIGFDRSCQTCIVDRGTMLPWLLKTFLGGHKLPVIKLPRYPDLSMDFSNVGGKMQVSIPNPTLTPVEMTALRMPEVDVSSLGGASESLASFTVPEIEPERLYALQNFRIPKINTSGLAVFNIPNINSADINIDIFSFLALGDLSTPSLSLPNFGNIGNYSVPTLQDIPASPQLSFPSIPKSLFASVLSIPSIARESIPEVPSLAPPSEIAQLSVPKIPNVPPLPKMPKFDLDLSIPAIPLPQLPTIPPPPRLPNVLGSLMGILSLPRAFLKLFCLLRLGVVPTPEWYVKPYVEQLSNRGFLLDLDFDSLSLPDLNFMNKELNIASSMGALFNQTALVDKVKGVAGSLSGITSGIGQQKRGGKAAPTAMPMGQDIQAMNMDNIPAMAQLRDWFQNFKKRIDMSRGYTDAEELLVKMQEEASKVMVRSEVQDNIRNKILAMEVPEKNLAHPLRGKVKERMGDIKERLIVLNEKVKEENNTLITLRDIPQEKFFAHDEVQQIFNQNESYFASGESSPSLMDAEISLPGDALNGLLAFVPSSTSEIPVSAPLDLQEGQDDAGAQESGADEVYVEPGIYYVDADSGLTEMISKFPVFGTQALLLVDIDDDDVEEIIFAVGNELYVKERFIEEKASPPEVEIERWDFQEFEKKFAPLQEVHSSSNVTGSILDFKRSYEEIPYYEWIISDRPDYVFEYSLDAEERKSEQWDRHAFYVHDFAPQVSGMTAGKIIDFQGTPQLSTKPFEKVENLDPDDCEDEEVDKDIFMEGAMFYAKQRSRLKYRLLDRGWREAPYTDITLSAGEELFLESAEVCVYRGSVMREVFGDLVETEVSVDQFLTSEATLVLGDGDAVTIELSDETEIELSPGEKYFFKSILPEEIFITQNALLELGNHYGFLKAKKFTRQLSVGLSFPKLLHDPQVSDDSTPPEIIILGGTQLRTSINQKLLIDATSTADEQELVDVWWDFDAGVDSDGDGDMENDRDFPFESSDYTPSQLLKIRLLPRSSVQEFKVVLNVKDASGNKNHERIEISVIAPELELVDASAGDKVIRGRLAGEYKDVPVWFLRDREGYESYVREDPVLSDKDGIFELREVSNTGGVEIIDQTTNMAVVEILETGRPVILDDRFGYQVFGANHLHPIRIRLRDEENTPLALIDFESMGEFAVEIVEEINPFLERVQVLDRNPSDAVSFESFPSDTTLGGEVALVDSFVHETLGVVDQRGGFYFDLASGVSLQVKQALDEEERVVFEVVRGNEIVGEVFVPVFQVMVWD